MSQPVLRAASSPPVVLLCDSADRHIGELGLAVPKSLLQVGDRPLLFHVMHLMARHGSNEFVLPVGALGHVVRDHFLRYELRSGNFIIRLGRQSIVRHLGELPEEGWMVTCVQTSDRAGAVAQLLNAAPYVSGWPVVVGYGDVLADVDVGDLVRYHRGHARLATMAVAQPDTRGRVYLTDDQRVRGFDDQGRAQAWLTSIGVFVFERAALDRYMSGSEDLMLEEEPIRRMAADSELVAYEHTGYWQPVDTSRDLLAVRRAWEAGGRPWDQATYQLVGIPAPEGATADGPQPSGRGPLIRLTPRELEVARLVSEGLTNRTVARRLRVAEKTVEMHLSNVFSKLDVKSRTELAGAVIRADWGQPVP